MVVPLFRQSTILTLYTLVAIPLFRFGPVDSGDTVAWSFHDVAILGVISGDRNLI